MKQYQDKQGCSCPQHEDMAECAGDNECEVVEAGKVYCIECEHSFKGVYEQWCCGANPDIKIKNTPLKRVVDVDHWKCIYKNVNNDCEDYQPFKPKPHILLRPWIEYGKALRQGFKACYRYLRGVN